MNRNYDLLWLGGKRLGVDLPQIMKTYAPPPPPAYDRSTWSSCSTTRDGHVYEFGDVRAAMHVVQKSVLIYWIRIIVA